LNDVYRLQRWEFWPSIALKCLLLFIVQYRYDLVRIHRTYRSAAQMTGWWAMKFPVNQQSTTTKTQATLLQYVSSRRTCECVLMYSCCSCHYCWRQLNWWRR